MRQMSIAIPSQVRRVMGVLEAAGYEAYIVGGCVRDSLMGKEPHDYDVTTDCTPDKMKSLFTDFHTIETGLKHGTLTVICDHYPVEVTTYRCDGDYGDHRRPDSVTFVRELKEDLKRRDFTVNAMCMDGEGRLIDLFGGEEDLNNKIIRCVGDPEQRFEEDALRIMRAMRFASVLDHRIDERTLAAMRKKAGLLSYVSAERIFSELKKLLCGRAAERVMTELSDLMALIIPELSPCIGCVQNNPHHCFDVYGHICRAVSEIEPEEDLRLTMLFHDTGKPLKKTTDQNGTDHFKLHQLASADIADTVLRRLKSSVKQRERVCALIREHDNRIPAERRAVRRFIAKYDFDFFYDWLKVRRADTLAQSSYYKKEKLAQLEEVEAVAAELMREESCFKLSDLAVNGRDLMSIGLKGSAIGEGLSFALSAVIDERVQNEREALLDLVRRHYDE